MRWEVAHQPRLNYSVVASVFAGFPSGGLSRDAYPDGGISLSGNERDRKNEKNATFINLHKPCELTSRHRIKD